MTMKLLAIYEKPENEDAFNQHYENVHTPIVKSIPGLQSLTVNRTTKHLVGDNKPYMIVEMAFADKASFSAAMQSDENRAAGKDIPNFAEGIVSLVVAES